MERRRKPEDDPGEQKDKIPLGEQVQEGALNEELLSLFSGKEFAKKVEPQTKEGAALENQLISLLSTTEPAVETKPEAEKMPEASEREPLPSPSQVREEEKIAEEKVAEELPIASEPVMAEARPWQGLAEKVAEVKAEEEISAVSESIAPEIPRAAPEPKKEKKAPSPAKPFPLLLLWRRWAYRARLFFLRLVWGRQRVITLSVEGTSLRFLSSLGDMIESWESIPFSSGLLRNGYVADPEGIGQVIRDTLEAKKITQGRVVCAFPGLNSSSRLLTLSQVAKAHLDKIVPQEAKRLMSVSLDGNYLVRQVLRGKTSELKVFVLAVPREPLLTWVQAVQIAGFRPKAIDLRPLALARAVNRKDAIIAHVEANCLELVVVVNDFPLLMRSIFLGEGGLPTEQVSSRMVEELSRTIAFYDRANPGRPLPAGIAVYLSGELATPALAGNIAVAIGYPIAPLEPPLKLPADLPMASFMVNLGLVLKMLR